MTRTPLAILIITLTFTTAACTTTVTQSELNTIEQRNSYDTRGVMYYKGRKGGYDYFHAQWNVGTTSYRVKINDSPVKSPIPYSVERKNWVRH